MSKSIGLKRKTVSLVPHNTRWSSLFQKEKHELERLLGSDAVAIEHIGSTSIPGIMAKPAIDISIGIKSFKVGSRIISKLEKEGYSYRPNWGRADQHILIAKGTDKVRTHYIHVLRYKGAIWNNDISFRDYLRSHQNWAKKYSDLKVKLAAKYPDDKTTYTKLKTNFVKKVLSLATKS